MYKTFTNVLSFVYGEVKIKTAEIKRLGFDPWVGKTPWSRKWSPTPVFLLRKPHGQRSLAGYSP